MDQDFSDIKSISPQFFGSIQKLSDEKDQYLLASAFRVALRFGGMNELDFVRSPEVNFNPRPARVAYILYNQCEVRSAPVLAAGVLAAVNENPSSVFESEKLPSAILQLRENALQAPEALYTADSDAQCIGVAVFLDRARHIHLSPKFSDDEFRLGFIAQMRRFHELSQHAKLPLEPYCAAWLKKQT